MRIGGHQLVNNNCKICEKHFSSNSYEIICGKCSKLEKIDKNWNSLDEMIRFYEGSEVYEDILLFRQNYKNYEIKQNEKYSFLKDLKNAAKNNKF